MRVTHGSRGCCNHHRAEHANALPRPLQQALLPLCPFALLNPSPKFCSNSSSTIITCSLSKCSRAAEHMCVCTCPECVCACSRRQCRMHDAVPRRLLARVRRHGSRPLQRERHRQRQHHVQQRACHHRPRSARLLSAPSFQHFTDFSHFPGLHLRCC